MKKPCFIRFSGAVCVFLLMIADPLPGYVDNMGINGLNPLEIRLTPEQDSSISADASDEPPNVTRKEVSRMEQLYDRLIYENMALYFDPSTFIVNSRINMVLVEQEFSERSLEQAETRSTGQTLPGLTALPDFLWQTQSQPETTLERTISQQVPDIEQIFVRIVVDESYTEEQRNFITYLVLSVSKLDQARGDVLNIETMAFPERLVRERVTAQVAGEPVAQTTSPIYALFSAGIDNLYYLAGIAAMLLFFTGFIIYVFLQNRRLKKEALAGGGIGAGSGSGAGRSFGLSPAVGFGTGQSGETSTFASNSNGVGRSQPKRNGIKETVFSGYSAEDIDPHELLYHYLMNFPGDMGRMMDMWITKNGEVGLDKAAKLIATADKRLITILQPSLSEKHGHRLKTRVLEIANSTKELPGHDQGLAKMVKEVTDGLKNRERKNCSDFQLRTLKNFDFLEYTPIHVLVTLLKDRDSYIISLVASHLTKERADELLYKLPESVLVDVWANMQYINLIQYEDYVRYADDLFFSVMNYEKYRIENKLIDYTMVDQICEQIESRDTIMQNRIYHQISQIDTEMAREIQARIITLVNLDTLPVEILLAAANRMDSEPLALAIAGVENTVIDSILQERSDRERTLLRSIIQKSKTYPAKQIEESRQLFLGLLRALNAEDTKDISFKINDTKALKGPDHEK